MNKWQLAVMALEVFERGYWPDDDALIALLEPDVAFLREYYEAHKRKMGFPDAAQQAKVLLLEQVEKRA